MIQLSTCMYIYQGEGTLVESRWPVSVRSIIGDGALCHSSGEEHNARRSAFMEAFDGETLEKFVPTIQVNWHCDIVTKKYGHECDRPLTGVQYFILCRVSISPISGIKVSRKKLLYDT